MLCSFSVLMSQINGIRMNLWRLELSILFYFIIRIFLIVTGVVVCTEISIKERMDR